MAALVLTAVATGVVSSTGIAGTLIGSAIVAGATVAGTFIDRALFGGGGQKVNQSYEGPRLQGLQVTSSEEGSPIPRGYGRYRTGGVIIWATRLEEEVVVTTTKQKGKGKGGGGGGSVTTTQTTYNYYANFAIALGEGVIGAVNRIWADGKPLDLTKYQYRVYTGTETQNPDSLIETKEGAGNVPAYRGVAYIVFERMPLERFGNRIPQMSIEVTRPIVNISNNNSVGDIIKGIDIIPGTTEFGYDPELIKQIIYGSSAETTITEERIENSYNRSADSDWNDAMAQIAATLPNVGTVALVVTWFGDDLRIGTCQLKPKVENSTKNTTPYSWLVSNEIRSTADVITQITHPNGSVGPAFGGTPNDESVIRAIQDLNSRGYDVMFYPFIIMDIPDTNTLPNPYSDNAATNGQPVFPWRGRITVSPAAGYVGTVDKTATAQTQIDSFIGSAAAGDFSASGSAVTYSGPNEWSFRRMILHYAHLCALAGGVDYFLIGTEMVGASTARSSSSNYPFVNALVTLASDVSGILGAGVKVSYAADWSEYHSHRPTDGTGDVYFNLDPLWSSSDIDFIGIDNYLPLSDWRDGVGHLDAQAGYKSVYDIDYLKDNIEGGEYYDWYYVNSADRVAQTRTNITDGAGKPWVFKNKDIKNWWLNNHVNRPGGVEAGGNTAWTPESKPIYFTEFGCPALDRGTNQPNVFFDPKSSESFLPYFSSGARDDEIQRQYVRATIEYWGDASNNPTSSVYADDMIDTDVMLYWAFDARPWPTFPNDGTAWADISNWQYGHWISDRVDTVFIPDLLAEISEDYGFTDYDYSRAYGSCDGYVLDAPMSFRDAIDPLMAVYQFDLFESGSEIRVGTKHEMPSIVTMTLDNVLDAGENTEPIMVTRLQETELPQAIRLRFIDILNGYEASAVEARREVVDSVVESVAEIPIVIDYTRAQQLADRWLYTIWGQREKAEFGVLPQYIYLEPGDVITLNANGFTQEVRIDSINDASGRAITAKTFDRSALTSGTSVERTTPAIPDGTIAAPNTVFMDLPLLNELDVEWQPYAVSYVTPWPISVSVFRSIVDSNYAINTIINAPGIIGETQTVFNSGPEGIWDYANELEVILYSGELESLDELSVLNGDNALAVENSSGGWEILQYVNAALIGDKTYRLSKLLRAQLGTEDAMEDSLPTGSRIVILNLALTQISMTRDDIGREYFYRHGPSSEDISSLSYNTEQLTFNGRGLKPYSPVQIEGVQDGSGDVTISWVRRTRIQGDNWEPEDVPLGENFERYEVDVLDGASNVVRTISVEDSTSTVYTAAQQSADSITIPFDVIVYQISEYVGRGIGRRTTING